MSRRLWRPIPPGLTAWQPPPHTFPPRYLYCCCRGGRRTQIAGCGIGSRHRLSLGHAHEQEQDARGSRD
eukprot:scaffold93338_cov57-Phaeocystis_antarctica.AAC.4